MSHWFILHRGTLCRIGSYCIGVLCVALVHNYCIYRVAIGCFVSVHYTLLLQWVIIMLGFNQNTIE